MRTPAQTTPAPILFDPKAPLSASQVRLMAKNARDDSFYTKLWILCLFMSGAWKAMKQYTGRATYSADPDLGRYPSIDPPVGPDGIQNHGLVNARINIQAIVYSLPELIMRVGDPMVREINQRWFEDVWVDQDLSGKGYETGMDVECMGVGFHEWGLDSSGKTVAEPFSPLDCLWDRTRRSPKDWSFFFRRRRLSLEDAIEKYGHLFSEIELEEMLEDAPQERIDTEDETREGQNPSRVLYEWVFWHKTTHCVFLKGINTQGSIMLAMDERFKYQIASEPGPNPFGGVPIAVWYDSFSPQVGRPVSKTETTMRLGAILNTIESYIVKVINRGLPVTTLSSFGLTPEQIEDFRAARTLDQLCEVVVVDSDDATKAIGRIVAEDIPPYVLQARQMFKEELNAATGVMDSSRGAIVPGQRTAYEAQIIESNGGTQSRHILKCYQRFLSEEVRCARLVGRFETVRRYLQLQDGIMDTVNFPVRPFLTAEYPIGVKEDSLRNMTTEQRETQRMMRFQSVDLAAIQAGVADPLKVFISVYQDLGVKDPFSVLYTPEELQAQQMQAMMVAMAGGGSEEPDDESK